jgi:very-short-patch-repair endonuclease
VQERTHRVARLTARLAETGDPAAHPWRDVTRPTWDPAWARRTVQATGALAEAIDAALAAAAEVDRRLGLSGATPTPETLAVRVRLARGLLAAHPLPAALLHGPEVDSRVATLRGWAAEGRALTRRAQDLHTRWTEALLRLPLEDLEARYQRWGRAFFLLAWILLWGARSRLAAVARERLGPADAITEDLGAAIAVRDGRIRMEARAAEGRAWLGGLWRGTETDWDAVEARLQTLELLAPALRALARELERPVDGLGPVVDAATDPQALTPADRAALEALVAAWAPLETALETWTGTTGGTPGPLPALRDRLRQALHAPDALRAWCATRAALDAAREAGLGPLVDAVLDGALAPEDLPRAWERSALQGWWEDHLAREPALAAFRGVEHGAVVRRFQALDAEALTLARQEIAARVAARVPDLHGPGDDLAFLRRQLQLQRRHQPVRRLFSRIGPILERIVPCALMSPLSVARYLDPALPGFDVVVFDEASQIPPWDAVGAIARGRQVVVVGDSQQLPPTTFFDTGGEDDDWPPDDEALTDTESILDEVVAAGLPELRLRWHYRSRHESLIAFSNHRYYDNLLHTFPSALREGLGVELRKVADGVYDRGRSRTNRGEAEAVVAELVALLDRPAASRPTVGVVTFSLAQQRLIEDLVDTVRAERPAVDAAFDDDLPEPAFVKNLESVQGDERDVMLFSIGYGPDRAGKVTMNFGPLNRRGGERRLNVAITRARERLVVFTSLSADAIDLLRTRAVGVAHLERFLAYAEHGIEALDRGARPAHEATFESPFEAQVHAALVRAGHTVHTQVGVSGYRIDLAVVDPDAPGRYLLAVECDGAAYHGAHGARERDRLRQAVLEGLGWRFHRVWSTDWWYERPAAERRLLEAVQEALDHPHEAGPQEIGRASCRERV